MLLPKEPAGAASWFKRAGEKLPCDKKCFPKQLTKLSCSLVASDKFSCLCSRVQSLAGNFPVMSSELFFFFFKCMPLHPFVICLIADEYRMTFNNLDAMPKDVAQGSPNLECIRSGLYPYHCKRTEGI